MDAICIGFLKTADFTGIASRFEYWWFLLFVLLVLAVASVITEKVLQIISLIVLLPLLAASTRRLRDAGHSGWWQLMFLVPFGQVVVLYLLSLKSRSNASELDQKHVETA